MKLTEAIFRRVLEAIPAKGATLRSIAELSKVHISNVRMAARLLEAGEEIFTMRAGTGKNSKHEVWVFKTAQAREEFQDQWLDEMSRRQKARQSAKAARRREARALQGRSMIAIAAERREARKRAEREREEAQRRALAVKLKTTQEKLKRQTAAAGATVFKAGTLSPKPIKTPWEDLPAFIPDGLEAIELPSSLRNQFDVKPEEVVPCFSSLRPGQYIADASNWVKALEAA